MTLITNDNNCPPAYGGCMCECHSVPGIKHCIACCYSGEEDQTLVTMTDHVCEELKKQNFDSPWSVRETELLKQIDDLKKENTSMKTRLQKVCLILKITSGKIEKEFGIASAGKIEKEIKELI